MLFRSEMDTIHEKQSHYPDQIDFLVVAPGYESKRVFLAGKEI